MSPLPGTGFAGARGGGYLNDYLLRLEQLLAVRLAASLSPGSSFLHGEREIIDGNLQLCLSYPANVTVRVLLLQTLTYMKKVQPELGEEFRERVEKLEREYALGEKLQKALDSLEL